MPLFAVRTPEHDLLDAIDTVQGEYGLTTLQMIRTIIRVLDVILRWRMDFT